MTKESKKRFESKEIKGIKSRFYLKTALAFVLALALALFATLFAYELPMAYDMTGQRLFTLSEESLEVIASIQSPLRIGAIYAAGNENTMVINLLEEYSKLSDFIETEVIDAQSDPALLSSYDLGDVRTLGNGTIIVNGNGRAKLINDKDLFSSGTTGNVFTGEREITGAIRYVTTDHLTRVYLTSGHGETNNADLSEAISRMRLNACEVNRLVTLQESIPSDAELIIIASPKSDFTQEEKEDLLTFLKRGGGLFLLLDPILNEEADPLINLSEIAGFYGVDISNNYVYEEDASYYLSNSNLYLIPRFGAHEITQQIGADERLVVLPLVRALREIDQEDLSATLSTLLVSSPKSWADFHLGAPGELGEDERIQGPFALGFAGIRAWGEGQSRSSRLVVLGNASFILDGNLGAQANADLLINSINWLAGIRDRETIAGKIINADLLMVRGRDFVRLAILICLVIPLVMFLGALAVWFLRRNK